MTNKRIEIIAEKGTRVEHIINELMDLVEDNKNKQLEFECTYTIYITEK